MTLKPETADPEEKWRIIDPYLLTSFDKDVHVPRGK